MKQYLKYLFILPILMVIGCADLKSDEYTQETLNGKVNKYFKYCFIYTIFLKLILH
jgi:hypothetical protein